MTIEDPELALATAYAPQAARAALAALWALDAALARVAATTTEPMIAQMRFTWWYDALSRLDVVPPPAEPVLRALVAHALPAGVRGAALGRLVEGWEALLDPSDADRLAVHADARGAGLFAAAGRVLGASDDPLAGAGRGWALIDHARRAPADTDAALALARDALDPTTARWGRAGRPLGMLAKLARRDVAHGLERRGSPRRMLAMATHAITGL